MKTMFALIIFCYLVTACSSSYVVNSNSPTYDSSVAEFNELAEGEEAEIILRDTVVNNATAVYLSSDSLYWNDSENILKNSVVKSDVRKVIISSKLIGGLEWLGIGTLAGGIAGYIIAVAPVDGNNGIIILSGFVVGALAGIITGIIIGHSYVFIISGY